MIAHFELTYGGSDFVFFFNNHTLYRIVGAPNMLSMTKVELFYK